MITDYLTSPDTLRAIFTTMLGALVLLAVFDTDRWQR